MEKADFINFRKAIFSHNSENLYDLKKVIDSELKNYDIQEQEELIERFIDYLESNSSINEGLLKTSVRFLTPIDDDNNRVKRLKLIKNENNLIDWLKRKLDKISVAKNSTTLEKIKWNCSPAVMGYIFSEFVRQNFIAPPLHNGEVNFTRLAKLCWQYFDISSNSEDYFIKQFRESSLSETKKKKFTIPDLKDIN